jgi:hypothetical protein
MSNLSIILKSNKCEFTNFFREPLIVPSNSEMALVKANMTVPVFVQQKLTIPTLDAAGRATRFVYIQVDGIPIGFTWTDLYTAYATLTDGLDQNGALLTAANFFSGIYSFFVNNPVWAERTVAVTNIQEKTTFNEAFALMCNRISVGGVNGFQFYNITARPTWIRNDPQIISGIVPFAAGVNDNLITFPNNATRWGINAEYNPATYVVANETPLVLDAADNAVWVTAPAQWTSAGGGVAGTLDNVYINNRDCIDPNGGWLKFQYNSVANSSYIGVSITTGNINPGGANLQPAVLPNPALGSIIDVGFKFTHVGATGTYQIIDDHLQTAVVVGGAIIDYVVPILQPSMNYRSFNNNADWFYIQVHRAGLVAQNQYKYVISLYRSDEAAPVSPRQGDGGVLLFQTTRILASPSISVSPIFLSDGVGNQVIAVQQIAATAQSLSQGDVDAVGQSGQGLIVIQQGSGNLTEIPPLRQDVIDFYSILSLETFQSPGTLEGIIQNDPVNTSLMLAWDRPLQILARDCDRYIGINDPAKIYQYITAPAHLGLQTDQANLTQTLPRLFDVSILDSTLKNASGNNPATAINGVAQNTFETTTIDKVVGTIPTDLDADKNVNFDWVISYEPFTPVYKPLNNSVPLTMSQMLVEVSYRDFNDGRKRVIETIDGTLNLELHIRPARKQPPVTNNIRPL